MELAPIILFTYNRPWHTAQTLEALAKNDLADQSVLYIYADGPKVNPSVEILDKISQTRQVIRQKQWCKEVHIIESEINKGLANSVMQGVTDIVNKHGKVIVLEDDIVTAKGFLCFMNQCLNIYEEEEKVFGITGYTYPSLQKNVPDTFFIKMGSSWGWATWKRAWKKFNTNTDELIIQLTNRKDFKSFDVGGYPFFDMLQQQQKGYIDSWAIRFYASIFLADSYFLFPKKALCQNIGLDNSGTHSGNEPYYYVELSDFVPVKKQKIEESRIARRGIEKSFQRKFTSNNRSEESPKAKLKSRIEKKVMSFYKLFFK